MHRILLAATLVLLSHIPSFGAEKPNILFIISDDQAWGDYGFMGHEVIRTPSLDKLARESAVFRRGYVPSSLCRPSLATLVTGLYPHQHGITGNDPPKGTNRAMMLKHIRQHPTVPKLLAANGYRCLQTGKWWEGSPRLGGFTDGMTHGDPRRGGRHGDVGLKIGREGLKPIFNFIEDCGETPFYIWYAPFLPHTPHNPPQRLFDKYKDKVDSPHVARYYAMCEWFDETCGALLDHLDERGLRKDTLVVYVTDNGWIQRSASRGYAPRSKRSPNEGGIRTPIMFSWPGKIPAAEHKDLVNSIDIVPTMLTACGVKPPADLPGLNLMPVFDGKPLARKAIFGEIFAHDVADIDSPVASLQYRWTIDERHKLILPHGGAKAELYDVIADPHEKKNLASDDPDTVKRLTGQINAWWSASGDSK